MSLDIQHIAALLHIANESAKHGPVLNEIHTRAMDELKEIHNDLYKERKVRGEEEAAVAAEKEAARVAEAKAEEDNGAEIGGITGGPEVASINRRGVE